jgi:hypothetical protein
MTRKHTASKDTRKIPQGLQKLIQEVEESLDRLPLAEEGSPEEQFRESVKILCTAIRTNPRDDGGQFLVPSFLGS